MYLKYRLKNLFINNKFYCSYLGYTLYSSWYQLEHHNNGTYGTTCVIILVISKSWMAFTYYTYFKLNRCTCYWPRKGCEQGLSLVGLRVYSQLVQIIVQIRVTTFHEILIGHAKADFPFHIWQVIWKSQLEDGWIMMRLLYKQIAWTWSTRLKLLQINWTSRGKTVIKLRLCLILKFTHNTVIYIICSIFLTT